MSNYFHLFLVIFKTASSWKYFHVHLSRHENPCNIFSKNIFPTMFVYYWNFICIHNPSQTDNHRTILLFIYLLIYFGIKMCGECSIQTIYLRGGWGNNNYFLLKKRMRWGFCTQYLLEMRGMVYLWLRSWWILTMTAAVSSIAFPVTSAIINGDQTIGTSPD